MPENRLPLDDARLTAYALGELDAGTAAEIEALLASSPDAREAFDEIREVANLLTSELSREPAPLLTESQRQSVLAMVSAEDADVETNAVEASPCDASQDKSTAAGPGALTIKPPVSQLPRRRWITRFASLATIMATVAVALLITPSSRPPESLVWVGPPSLIASNTVMPGQREGWNFTSTSNDGEMSVELGALGIEGRSPTMLGGSVAMDRKKSNPVQNVRLRQSHSGNGIFRTPGLEIKAASEPAAAEAAEAENAPLYSMDFDSNSPQPPVASKPQSRSAGTGGGNSSRNRPTSRKEDEPRRAKLRAADAPETGGNVNPDVSPAVERRPASWHYAPATVEAQQPIPFKDAPPQWGAVDAWGDRITLRPRYLARLDRPDSLNDEAARTDQYYLYFALPSQQEGDVARRQSTLPALTGESAAPVIDNLFLAPTAEPVSTFGIDVDTTSYQIVRHSLQNGQLPPRHAVRIEGLLNSFAYDDPPPADDQPVAVHVEVGRAPWRPDNRLVRIGLKGREISPDRRPPTNLVFVVNVSASMSAANKLPLVKAGLSLLVEQLGERDRVALVTYSDTAAVRLASTACQPKQPLLEAIKSLEAHGATTAEHGLQMAYEIASGNFVETGANRVFLCTDEHRSAGPAWHDALAELPRDKARKNVSFSVIGFGVDPLHASRLEQITDQPAGQFACVDGLRDARQMFVDELSGTLFLVARNVQLRVEFNPVRVGAYRLIGYEDRLPIVADVRDNREEPGNLGAGHSVTALYEIVPADRIEKRTLAESLRYQVAEKQSGALSAELLTVQLRCQRPDGDPTPLVKVHAPDRFPLASDPEDLKQQFAAGATIRPSRDFDWAAAVATFGMVLRNSPFRGQADVDLALQLAQEAKGEDPTGRRQEFIDLIQAAAQLGARDGAGSKAD